MMQWEKLLSLKRQGDLKERTRKAQDDTRLGFEVDYDRIIFSSAFRSLQDKTQVIPLSKTDFVHTRLTHSLEVSVAGRTLGRLVGKELLSRHKFLQEKLGYHFNDIGAIVAAACLAHDIGNPPFGHSGEKAIGAYFKTGGGSKYEKHLDEAQYFDLTHFEGNANGFKILTESRNGISGGLRLSYATLGAFTKYPKASVPVKPSKHVSQKKFGFFQSQHAFFEELASDLGLLRFDHVNNKGWHRHPLCFLVEAADDICYTIIDFEDGVNLGWIDEEQARAFFDKLIGGRLDRSKFDQLELKKDRMSYLRALAIGTLINEAVTIFLDHETELLQGQFSTSLLEQSVYKSEISAILDLSVRSIYQSRSVIDKEIAGYKILSDILDVYCMAAIDFINDKRSHFTGLVLKTLPADYKITKENSCYDALLQVCCFVASLSDGRAVALHEKLVGLKL